MKIPAHLTIEIAPDEERQLNATHRAFIAEMEQLTPQQRLARATVIAGGIRKRDPLTRALAQQLVDVDRLNSEAKAAQEEIDFINSSQRRLGHGPTPIQLARREVLQRQVEETRLAPSTPPDPRSGLPDDEREVNRTVLPNGTVLVSYDEPPLADELEPPPLVANADELFEEMFGDELPGPETPQPQKDENPWERLR
jgi:hypothetical protein